jgi:hypothetical protein
MALTRISEADIVTVEPREERYINPSLNTVGESVRCVLGIFATLDARGDLFEVGTGYLLGRLVRLTTEHDSKVHDGILTGFLYQLDKSRVARAEELYRWRDELVDIYTSYHHVMPQLGKYTVMFTGTEFCDDERAELAPPSPTSPLVSTALRALNDEPMERTVSSTAECKALLDVLTATEMSWYFYHSEGGEFCDATSRTHTDTDVDTDLAMGQYIHSLHYDLARLVSTNQLHPVESLALSGIGSRVHDPELRKAVSVPNLTETLDEAALAALYRFFAWSAMEPFPWQLDTTELVELIGDGEMVDMSPKLLMHACGGAPAGQDDLNYLYPANEKRMRKDRFALLAAVDRWTLLDPMVRTTDLGLMGGHSAM